MIMFVCVCVCAFDDVLKNSNHVYFVHVIVDVVTSARCDYISLSVCVSACAYVCDASIK